ncbi:hypothetical protein [Rickettsia endosymbiont of Gonocerus acuteangulatus]
MLIPPYYAASGGEYTQKRFKPPSPKTDIINTTYNTLFGYHKR